MREFVFQIKNQAGAKRFLQRKQAHQGDKPNNMNTLANIQKVMDIQFEISQKKTYEVKNASKTTEFDA